MTIINDLEKVNCWLTRFDLRLEKRQNYGCTLFGSESSLRRAIIALVFETVGEIELLTLFGNLRLSASFTLHDKTIITQRIGSFIRTLNLELLHAAVDQIQDLTHLTFTDHAHMYLTLYIGIQIYRIKLGKFEETRNSTTQVFQTNAIFVSITPWIKTVERSISVFFPEQEVYELAKQIMGTETRHSISNSSENELNDSEETIKVQRILDLILETATMYLHPALRRDRRLRDDLASHLKNDVNVSGFIPKTNSLLSEVKNRYSDVY
jgi:transcriptional antiterminator